MIGSVLASVLAAALPAALAFAAGLACGAAHFASLRAVATAWATGAAVRALGLQLLRWLVLVAAAVVAARQGALPLLAGTLGLLAARSLVVGRSGGTP